MADWYYAQNGTQLGPISEQQLRTLISGGELRSDDLVWREGLSQWQSAASAFPDLFQASPASGLPPIPPGVPPYGQAMPPHGQAMPPHGQTAYSAPGGNYASGQSSAPGSSIPYAHAGLSPSYSGVRIPVLISAIFNVLLAIAWLFGTLFFFCCGAIVAVPLIVLAVYEFSFYNESLRLPSQEVARKAHTLGIWEIVLGVLSGNIPVLVCGIITVVNAGKLMQPYR